MSSTSAPPGWLIFYSKKFWVTLAGLIFAILAANGVICPPDIKKEVLELIAILVGAFDVGQGVADGVSGGRTSGVALKAGAAKNAGA
jgi:hypothetical protein